MDIEQLLARLRELDADSIDRAAAEIDRRDTSAADEIAWWTAQIEIDRLVTQRRLRLPAAAAAARAASAVTHAARRAGLDSHDTRVVAVARAAGDLARAVTAGTAVNRLLGACPHLAAA